MTTGNRIRGLQVRSLATRGAEALVAVALLGLAPLAASSAAAPDPAARAEPVVSAAAVELVPLPVLTDAAASTPDAAPAPASVPSESIVGRGSASYYAAKFDGRRTASGERFDNDDFTAAHRTLPFGSRVRVTNLASGRSVVVRINDRGPFTRGRMIDVSRAAADELGLVARGHADVELALLSN